ncbi:amino acid ABC transporter permease [bacterium]|nr:MAG: amino acid ABC transporter permease [bacterium]
MAPLLDLQFDWTAVLAHKQQLIAGAWIDLWGASVSFLIACVVGLLLAILRNSRIRIIDIPCFFYVQLVRGVPLYVLLLWVYFGVATVVGLNFSAIQAMIIALALTGSGYTAEIFRAGIDAVQKEQMEAAQALGLSKTDAYLNVVLPQMFRIVVPPLGNQFIGLLKGATIVSVIGVQDMVFYAQDINLAYFTPFEAFAAVGIILVFLVTVFAAGVYGLERAIRLP